MTAYVFRIGSRLKPVGSGKIERTETINRDRQAICAACEWYQQGVSRCTRPNSREWSVCYRSNARVNPWKWIRSCPEW